MNLNLENETIFENLDTCENSEINLERQKFDHSSIVDRIDLPLLLIIKCLQDQNGMKHKDFAQYRRYCTRKLHRLRSGLNMNCGRVKYQKSNFEIKDYKEVRHFLILVLLIERCWSFGNELGTQEKSISSKSNSHMLNNRKKFHIIRKLKKGVLMTDFLLEVARQRCNARTIVEIKAYRSYILSHYQMKCSNWKKGLLELRNCLKFYQQLKLDFSYTQNIAEILPILNISTFSKKECLKIYEDQISEITPLIRLCSYHCKRLGIEIEPEDFKTDQSFNDLLHSSDSDIKIVYNEINCTVNVPGMEILLVELGENYRRLKKCIPIDDISKIMDYSTTKIVECFSETLMSSSSISAKINEQLTILTAGIDVSSLNNSLSEWTALESYAREFNLFVSIERDLVLLLQLINYFNDSNFYLKYVLKSREIIKDDIYANFSNEKFLNTRYPEEGVRICDILNFSISEINLNSKNKNIPVIVDTLKKVTNNCRSLFLSHCYALNDKFREAYLLSDLVKSRLEIRELQHDQINDKSDYIERITFLINKISLITSEVTEKSFNICLSCLINREHSRFLSKTYEDDAIGGILDKETLLPKFTPISVKPIMFDIASDFITLPEASIQSKKDGIVSKIFSKATAKLGFFK